jgi:iron complex outermembrane receptor protein
MKSFIRGTALCTVALGALAAKSAAAQENSTLMQVPAPAAIERPAGTDVTVGDIVVTARRQAEAAQSVPVTISAFSAETLRSANALTATSLQRLTPGISTQGSGSDLNSFYSIRGISRQISGNSQPGVISYFAEVPLPNAPGAIPLFDMANVQVLKGPQGTLFGRNTVGGAILFYPATPNYEMSGYLLGRVQNYDGRAVEGSVNVPIVTDKIAIRVAGLYDGQGGYQTNFGIAGPRLLGGRTVKAIRGSLLLEPFEGFRNTTIVDWDHTDDSSATQLLSGPTAAGAPTLQFLGGLLNPANPNFIIQTLNNEVTGYSGPRQTNTGPLSTGQIAERRGVVNRTEIDLSETWSLTNIFGFRTVEYASYSNFDSSSLPLLDVARSFNFHQLSNEVQISGSLLEDRISLLFGGFYLKSTPAIGNFNATTALFSVTPQYFWERNESKALFGNLNVKLDGVVQGLRFNAGFRYTWDKQSICGAAAITGAGAVPGIATRPFDQLGKDDCKPTTPGITNVATGAASSKAPGWTIGLDWQASRSLFLYAVTRRGYRSGGVNNPTLGTGLSGFQAYKPETNTDVELGVKSDWRVGGMVGRLNISGFYSWQKGNQIAFTGINQPASVCNTNGGTAPVWIDGDCDRANNPASGALVINAADTRVKGIEAELVLKPTRTLTLNLLGSLLSPSISKVYLPGGPLVAFVGGIGTPDQFVNQNISKRSLSAAAHFDLPVPDNIGQMTLSANYYYTSENPVNALIIPSYDETSARLDWKNVAGGKLDFAFFVNNVFNQTHVVAAAISPVALSNFFITGAYNNPRIYGFEARVRW